MLMQHLWNPELDYDEPDFGENTVELAVHEWLEGDEARWLSDLEEMVLEVWVDGPDEYNRVSGIRLNSGRLVVWPNSVSLLEAKEYAEQSNHVAAYMKAADHA